jgi:hypothetical protein
MHNLSKQCRYAVLATKSTDLDSGLRLSVGGCAGLTDESERCHPDKGECVPIGYTAPIQVHCRPGAGYCTAITPNNAIWN